MPMPAKSIEVHTLQGTKSDAAHAPSEADALQPSRPKYPKGITGESRAAFKRLVRMLESRRHLTEGDAEILRLYCVLLDRHTKALAKLAEEGEVKTYWRLDNRGERCPSERPNHWLKISETCESKMLACLSALGLTPTARKNVKPTAKPPAPAVLNELDLLLERRPAAPAPPDEISIDDPEIAELLQ
jgi:P27 family predicted phage terminase small subunit